MKISVIIINYQTKDLTLAAVESIKRERRKYQQELKETEIIVVDNQSPDGSGEELAKLAAESGFMVIQNPKNNGFAAGNELGYQKASGEIILLLNSDATLDEGALYELWKIYEKKMDIEEKIGVISCQLWNERYLSLQIQGGDTPSIAAVTNHMLGRRRRPTTQYNTLKKTDEDWRKLFAEKIAEGEVLYKQGWVAGTAMSFRRETVEKAGFLDTNIFMYGEDMEFCYRVKQKMGLKAAVLLTSRVEHLGSASAGNKRAIVGEFEGLLYLWKKHFAKNEEKKLRQILKMGAMLRMILKPKEREAYQELLRVL